VAGVGFIGKEADGGEDDEQFAGDEDSPIEYDLSAEARVEAAQTLRLALKRKG
jgi:hypothetical protein